MATRNRRRAPRGVVLLIILGLMAMFGMVAISLVLVGGHARRGAEAHQRGALYIEAPRDLTHQALLQILRGTDDPRSVVGPHSLFEDVYGNRAVGGTMRHDPGGVAGPQPSSFGENIVGPTAPRAVQLIEFSPNFPGPPSPTECVKCVGCVLTVLSGPAEVRLRSTRIVGYVPPPAGGPQGLFQIAGFEDVSTPGWVGYLQGDPTRSCMFMINGPAFSGTGFGYGGGAPPGTLLNATDSDGHLFALRPNPSAPSAAVWAPEFKLHVDNPDVNANEGCDVPDYQNMLMALQVPVKTPGSRTVTSVVRSPSLHRPALINYWMNHSSGVWANVDFQRKVILRPLPQDHPNFPVPMGFSWLSGPWDVDNDGDLIPDSIWVDFGFPVRQMPDGRLCKPLGAVLLLDQDGRANLNANGCWAQAQSDPNDPATGSANDSQELGPYDLDPTKYFSGLYYRRAVAPTETPIPAPGYRFAPVMLGGPGSPQPMVDLPRGLGHGPAEINLLPLFEDLIKPTAAKDPPPADYEYYYFFFEQYKRLLAGNPGALLEGRYGELGAWPTPPSPGVTGNWEAHWFNKQFDYASNYSNFPNLTAYATPPDLRGFLSLGLDIRGMPLYTMLGGYWMGTAIDHAYEVDLSRNAPRGQLSITPFDNPFALGELEPLLRPFDRDRMNLPDRLVLLGNVPENLSSGQPQFNILFNRRHEITADSWDLPCPSIAGAGVRHLTGLLTQHPEFTVGAASVPDQLRLMLSPEVLAGMRMDLNRRFGNGEDNPSPGNGVVDEFEEALAGETFPQADATRTTSPVSFDHDNDGAAGLQADPRHFYARHLYVLMMASADLAYLDAQHAGFPVPRAETARLIAQWAINVADFRDRDAIMTPFEYDINPFNGWDVDGWITTDEGTTERAIVWGCERPELLFAEALAFHDNRTEDTAQGGWIYPPNPGDPQEQDDPAATPPDVRDFDQRFLPQGSLFFELYNPWANHRLATMSEAPPGEFYAPGGVDLSRRSLVGGSPVWRVKISEPEPNPADDPDPDDAAAERCVYFVDLMAAGTFPTDGDVQYYPSTPPSGPIAPGGYAVIGSGDRRKGTAAERVTTYVGFRTDSGDPPVGNASTRRIVLSPGQLPVENNTDPLPPGVIPMPQFVVVDSARDPGGAAAGLPRRMSVSEPTAGYEPQITNAGATYDANTEQLNLTVDEPFDAGRADALVLLRKEATAPRYRNLHLQRLANPLQPHDPDTNPYRTIDSMSVDLTAFTGVTSQTPPAPWDAVGPVRFDSCQRGERNDDHDLNTAPLNYNDFNLWKQEPPRLTVDPTSAHNVASHYFAADLRHSLGYLIDDYGYPGPRTNPPGPAGYEGDPQMPFPWLTWLNRPFTNPLELLLVPTLRSSRLLSNDAANDASDPTLYYNGYRIVRRTGTDPDPAPNPFDPTGTADLIPYPHLLNFFQSAASGGAGADSAQFHRFLEYVRVPSPFVRTELHCDPLTFEGVAGHTFHPPFHGMPTYREPGRINLNTLFSEEVFRGLLNRPDLSSRPPGVPSWIDLTGFPGADASLWDNFISSRRGYGATSDPMLQLDPNYPTFFANPFRSSAGPYLVPLDNLRTSIDREVNSTLLRDDPDDPSRPLFQARYPDGTPGSQWPVNNIDRNPFFRYLPLSRLANLVTTRSNVYAIWITIGYFEVEPAPMGTMTPQQHAAVYPDGYWLGPEVGSDTGEVKRHRAFYIVDRSIPVGFQRGQDINVEDAVLIERFIE